MDVPHRNFSTRNSRPNGQFEQIRLSDGSQQKHSQLPLVVSPRKRVNIVTFRTTPSPTDNMAASTEQQKPPPPKQPRITESVSQREIPSVENNSANLQIAPKFKRVDYASPRDGGLRSPLLRLPFDASRSINRNGSTASTIQRAPKLITSQSMPAKTSTSRTTTRPAAAPSTADPYAWVEEEEEEEEEAPKFSEYAVEENDDEDEDCVSGSKPWFWPASRDTTKAPVKQQPVKAASTQQSVSSTATSRGGKITVSRDQKSLYTVVEKVKAPHECQERGGVQHTIDDLNYLIDGLSADSNNVNTRSLRRGRALLAKISHKLSLSRCSEPRVGACPSPPAAAAVELFSSAKTLDILSLATKCLSPMNRDLIQAYGLLKQICANLKDAHTDYSLGLTTAGFFFILSRDRDPEIFSSDCLAVLLNLLRAPNAMTSAPAGNSTTTTTTATASSKYTVGAASHQARLNKEAGAIRSRVQQLLDAVAKQQQQQQCHGRARKSEEGMEESPTSKQQSSSAAALFVRKSASLFASSGAPSVSLNARHLRMNRHLTTRDLVIEVLLNIATRKAAGRFKTEMRTLGGLDAISDATIDAVDYLKDLLDVDSASSCLSTRKNPTGLDDFSLDNLKRVGYYAKMLENMTCMNTETQTHIVRYKERCLIDRLVMCIRLCASRLPRHAPPSTAWADLQLAVAAKQDYEKKESGTASSGRVKGEEVAQLPSSTEEPTHSQKTPTKPEGGCQDVELQPDQQTLLNCLLAIFRLFVNISHSEYASDRLGGCPNLLEVTLDCLFHLPDRFLPSRRFDLLILILCLLANLCEHCPENRIRIVHLEVQSPESTATRHHRHLSEAMTLHDASCDNERDVDKHGRHRWVPTVSALDEVVRLFLYREKKTLMHEFEREDDKARDPEEADSTTTTTATSTTSTALQRPLPPPSLLAPDATGETIEEAGLKWRLIGGGRKTGGVGDRSHGSRSKSSKRSRLLFKRRRRRLALLRRRSIDAGNHNDSSSEDQEDNEEVEEEDMDSDIDDVNDGIGFDSEEGSDEEDDYGGEDDDDMCGGGADVEFVAETAEEQEKLKERMSSANQHMEDSVVAAYAALLLGCILQSSPRYTERIRSQLPGGKFRPLAIMLAKLLSFLSLARGVESAGSESILRIVRTLEAQDSPVGSAAETPSSSSATSSNNILPTTRSGLRRRQM